MTLKPAESPVDGAPADDEGDEGTATLPAAPGASSKKERSPNYPAMGLLTAIRLLKKIYDAEKKSPMRADLAAKHMGYASLSGPARVAVSALRKYGLLVDAGPQQVRVSDDGVKIVVYPETHEDRQAVIARAALKPEIYKEILGKYGHELPSDDNLRGYLIADRGFTDGAAIAVIKGLRETMGIANLSPVPDTPTDDESEGEMITPGTGEAALHRSPMHRQDPPPPGGALAGKLPSAAPVHVLTLGPGQSVSIYATAPMTSEHHQLLIKVLGLLSTTTSTAT